MTNPDNIVRVRARNGGRASVYEANAWCQNWTTGFVEGSITQNTSADMNILVNGSPSKPAVAIAATPAPYNIALDIVGQKAIAITAPATNSRYSAIVAYTDDLSLATTEDTVTGSPASCGLIVVNGTASATPVYPTDATIRTAITADGATGSQAAYVVLAYILVSSNTTTITNSLISNSISKLRSTALDYSTLNFGNYSYNEVDTGFTWVDGKHIFKKTIYRQATGAISSITMNTNISNGDKLVNIEVVGHASGGQYVLPIIEPGSWSTVIRSVSSNLSQINIKTDLDSTLATTDLYATIYYTKTS